MNKRFLKYSFASKRSFFSLLLNVNCYGFKIIIYENMLVSPEIFIIRIKLKLYVGNIHNIHKLWRGLVVKMRSSGSEISSSNPGTIVCFFKLNS